MWVPLELTSRFILGPLSNTKVFQCSIGNRSFSFRVSCDHHFFIQKVVVKKFSLCHVVKKFSLCQAPGLKSGDLELEASSTKGF